jgi:hypothetical protein
MRNETCKSCKLDNVVPRTEKNTLCNLSGFQSYKPGVPPCGSYSAPGHSEDWYKQHPIVEGR